MHISFALFADAANLSQEGKLNILGVFDAVQVGALPSVHPRATLVVRLKGTRQDVGTHKLELRWVSPRGEELWGSAGELVVGLPPVDVHDMDLPVVAALDLPLDVPGEYRMRLALDGELAAEVPLQVRTGGAVTATPGPAGTQGLVS